MTDKNRELKIITHYKKEDTKFYEDYCDIEIFLDGILIKQYEDGYHDKGKEKTEGFVHAIHSLWPFIGDLLDFVFDVKYENVADRKW
jgi:hypothetical protein